MSDFLWPHGLQHTRLPCPSLSPSVCTNSCPLSQWCHPAVSSSLIVFSSCLQSFSASGSFPTSQLFESGDQSIGASASASVLPMNTQDWFPLGLTGFISLQSKGLSRILSAPQLKNINSSVFSLYGPTLTSLRDCGKNHSFDYVGLCWQSNASVFLNMLSRFVIAFIPRSEYVLISWLQSMGLQRVIHDWVTELDWIGDKLDKSKTTTYSKVVFKQGCSLETYLELSGRKNKSWTFVLFKNFQNNSDIYLDFKRWLQVFLSNGSFGDIEFYYFSVD